MKARKPAGFRRCTATSSRLAATAPTLASVKSVSIKQLTTQTTSEMRKRKDDGSTKELFSRSQNDNGKYIPPEKSWASCPRMSRMYPTGEEEAEQVRLHKGGPKEIVTERCNR